MARGSNKPLWLMLVFIWGSTWLAIKVGLEDLPPFTFAGLRFLVALVPLTALMVARGRPLPRAARDWVLLVVTGLLTFGAGYGLVFWGEQYVTSGLTAVLFTTYPVFGLLFAHFLISSEPLTARRLGGGLLSLAGVGIIFADQLRLDDPRGVWGAVAVIGSAASGAFSGVLVKRYAGHVDAVVLTVCQMAFGGLPLLLLGLLVEGDPLRAAWTVKAVLCLLYLALVGSSLAFVLWYRLLRATMVTRAQVLPVLNTLVAVGLGWLVLGEAYGLRGAVGAMAVLTGVVISLWRRSGSRRVREQGSGAGRG